MVTEYKYLTIREGRRKLLMHLSIPAGNQLILLKSYVFNET